MLLLILAWVVAIIRPSYVMLFAFGAAVIAFSIPAFLTTTTNEHPVRRGRSHCGAAALDALT
jgi:hypothetical protein